MPGPRHHLEPWNAAATVEQASEDLVGFHGTDPTSMYLAAWARVRDFAVADLERALYEDRSLLKVLGMRRTMFVVPRDLAAVIQAACTDAIAARERRLLERLVAEAGLAPASGVDAWLRGVEDETLAALEAMGEATAADLAKAVEPLRAQIAFGGGRKWQGTVGVSTRLLFVLSAEGRIVRGRPKGSIVSSLYRWVPMARWIGAPPPTIAKADAQAELARRYLATYGPATLVDLRWWAGWTATEAKAALARIDAREVERADGKRAWVLADDPSATDQAPGTATRLAVPEPWTNLLPALDPTVMGWQERGWFLGPHAPRLFDRNGNAGPTIWLDGRVVGGWAQQRDGSVASVLLEDVGPEGRLRVEERVEALRGWLGDLRFVPRFRTPVEQELTA